MKTQFNRITRPELYFHLFFWLAIAIGMIAYVSWTKVLFLNGVLFLTLTTIIPVYINALWLIPIFLEKQYVLKYLIGLSILILSINIISALLLASSLATMPNSMFDLLAEFEKWLFRDFGSLDKFVFSKTAWVLYLSFSYYLIRDWYMRHQIYKQLKAENNALELALNQPSEIRRFLNEAYNFSNKFGLTHKLTGDFFFINTGSDRRKLNFKDILYIEDHKISIGPSYRENFMMVVDRNSLK